MIKAQFQNDFMSWKCEYKNLDELKKNFQDYPHGAVSIDLKYLIEENKFDEKDKEEIIESLNLQKTSDYFKNEDDKAKIKMKERQEEWKKIRIKF